MTVSFPINGLMAQRRVLVMIGAAVAVSVFVALPALVNASASSSADKGDLADAQTCEMQNWPYYARACLRDETRNAGGRAVKPRMVSTDRLDLARTRAADPDHVTASASEAEAPAGWVMSDRDVSTYVSAGEFIRRTVR